MDYNSLYSDFRTLFSSDGDRLDQLTKAAYADEGDRMHIMFSFVVIPFVIGLLHKNNTEKLTKAFRFFEEMASSDDTAITEVLEFTVIENLMSNGKTVYEQAVKYTNRITYVIIQSLYNSCSAMGRIYYAAESKNHKGYGHRSGLADCAH